MNRFIEFNVWFFDLFLCVWSVHEFLGRSNGPPKAWLEILMQKKGLKVADLGRPEVTSIGEDM